MKQESDTDYGVHIYRGDRSTLEWKDSGPRLCTCDAQMQMQRERPACHETPPAGVGGWEPCERRGAVFGVATKMTMVDTTRRGCILDKEYVVQSNKNEIRVGTRLSRLLSTQLK